MSEKVVTEDDIAAYLLSAPDFFERYSDVLAGIQLTSPRGQRSVSLQERQMELLRDKIKALELRMAHMMRVGAENDQTHEKLHRWVLTLLSEQKSERIPSLLIAGLQDIFSIPQVGLRAWNLAAEFEEQDFAKPVSDDVRTFIKGMNGEPYCGHNPDLEVVSWLDDPSTIRSVALLPLSMGSTYQPFGLLVFGAEDVQRFTADMAVDILKSIATITSTVLQRCMAEKT